MTRIVPVLIFVIAAAGFSYHSAIHLKKDMDNYLAAKYALGGPYCSDPAIRVFGN